MNSIGARLSYIVPTVSFDIKYTYKSRKKDVSVTRLGLGRCKLNYYMHKMGLHDSGLCSTCRRPVTIKHYILECNESNIHQTMQRLCDTNRMECSMKNILNDQMLIDELYRIIKRDL